jgi:diguanylate cyclase
MKPDDRILQIISNETKDSIDKLSVVTPSIFASIFSKFAQEHNASIENEDELSHDLMKLECSNLTKMQAETSKNADILSQSTSKAINAIKVKDEALLNQVLQETEKLRLEVEKLKESVYKDELTNLYNRKWLHDKYTDDNASKFTTSGALAIIDLNYFKIINDTHGHIIGDKVLIFLANQFKKTSYPVVRYGGDEFLLLIPNNVTPSIAAKTIHELRENIITKKLKAHESTFKVSFSFGLTSFKTGDELALVIEEADKNMYEDKIAIKKRITGI